MNDVIAKMVEEDPESEDGKRKVQKLVDRDVKKLRNDVERQVSQCKQDCPSECDSCGSAKIEELKLKLQVYLFVFNSKALKRLLGCVDPTSNLLDLSHKG